MNKSINGEINFFGKRYKAINPIVKDFALRNKRELLINGLNESATNLRQLLKVIDSIWKKELKSQLKKKFYRNWIKATVRRALGKIKQAKKIAGSATELPSNKKLIECIDIALLSVGFAQKLLDSNNISSIFFKKRIEDHLIPLDKIKKGDVILSYKTTSYLNSHFLSKLIYYATTSKLTHTRLVSEKNGNKLKLISSQPETKGVKEANFELQPGEIFFVLRPTISEAEKKTLFEKMKETINLSQKNPSKYKFSEKKCWIACFIGLLYSGTMRICSRNLVFSNPIQKIKGYHCTEFIEELFYSSGIYLTARSNSSCRGVAGPIEIFNSPHLQYKGIFFNSGSRIDLEKELTL